MADNCAKLQAAVDQVGLFASKHKKALKELYTDIEKAISDNSEAHLHKLEIERKRELKAKSKITPVQIKKLSQDCATLGAQCELNAHYTNEWHELVSFEMCDAAKPNQKYVNERSGEDISHIYSYNKVMSKTDCQGICEILNRTNFKILAWYYGPKDTESFGLKNFELLCKMPMASTGAEKF